MKISLNSDINIKLEKKHENLVKNTDDVITFRFKKSCFLHDERSIEGCLIRTLYLQRMTVTLALLLC